LGLAFSNQRIIILVVAIIPLIALMVIDQGLRRTEAAVELRGLILENKYAPDADTALLHLLIAVSHTSSNWVERLNAFNNIKDLDKRIMVLRRTRPGLPSAVVIPLLAFIEIGLGVSLWVAGWKLF
jgi:hypothetical protein